MSIRYAWGSTAGGPVVQRRMAPDSVASIPLPSASAVECVRVLVSFGWMAASWTDVECVMTRGSFCLTVPLQPRLDGRQVGAVVRQAGVSPIVFVDALERIRSLRTATTE